MSRKAQFILCGENAQTRESFRVGGLLNENCFAQIHFACDIEHAAGGETVTINDDGERISGERRVGENIELVEASLHNFLRSQNCWCANNIFEGDFRLLFLITVRQIQSALLQR
jgi:hypothetical protein